MSNHIYSNGIKRNIALSIIAQAVVLAISMMVNLIVPKFIGVEEYAYWQTYVLYSSYVGILHFGLLDGMVLRYSKYNYEDLNKAVVRFQYNWLLASDLLMSLIITIWSIVYLKGNNQIVALLVSVSILTRHSYTYTSYLFQITNRISQYIKTQIVRSCTFGICVIFLLLLKEEYFLYFCISDLLADTVAVIYGATNNRGLFFGKAIKIRQGYKELLTNIKAGILLLIANWTANFLVGSAKLTIQWKWDIITFGKVSFGFSITNLFLTFVSAISVVLFPTLRRMDERDLPNTYVKIRNFISPLMIASMILYYPGCIILRAWLPAYNDSLVYAGILLPLVIFASKVSLLTNNYLKAYRKEKTMLYVNLAMAMLGLALSLASAYVLQNLEITLCVAVFVIMLRSIVSEIVVSKIINRNFYREFLIEALMTIIFIIAANFFEFWIGCIVYLVALAIYLFVERDKIKPLISYCFKRLYTPFNPK